MSDTPRTNAATFEILSALQSGTDKVVKAEVAAELERELAAERARADTLQNKEKTGKCQADMWADPPRDCGWPDCGCDTEATRVIELLLESGWVSPTEHRKKLAEANERAEKAERDLIDMIDTVGAWSTVETPRQILYKAEEIQRRSTTTYGKLGGAAK